MLDTGVERQNFSAGFKGNLTYHVLVQAQEIWLCSPDCFLSEGAWWLDTRLNCATFSPCHGRSFFDLCDGIFLNYNWTEEGLRSSNTLAGGRKGEVYVGIDVFGRGCPGGGGYNSCEVGGASLILSRLCAENTLATTVVKQLKWPSARLSMLALNHSFKKGRHTCVLHHTNNLNLV